MTLTTPMLVVMARKPKVIDPFDVALGAVVRSKRVKVGLSQTDFASRVGIPSRNYQRREDGSISITVSELERIAEVTRTPAHSIVEEALADYGGIELLLSAATTKRANVGDYADDEFDVAPSGPKSDYALIANERPKKADIPHAE